MIFSSFYTFLEVIPTFLVLVLYAGFCSFFIYLGFLMLKYLNLKIKLMQKELFEDDDKNS